MVEIILRKDIQDYEARPLFGFTYRQVATGAAIAITAADTGMSSARYAGEGAGGAGGADWMAGMVAVAVADGAGAAKVVPQ